MCLLLVNFGHAFTFEKINPMSLAKNFCSAVRKYEYWFVTIMSLFILKMTSVLSLKVIDFVFL